ncbi:MAG: hypothetical protein CHACPFDD_00545 [Phycisphaerae bacterium]|nr:hypothetical protein [Phycisphaerae bacterium]
MLHHRIARAAVLGSLLVMLTAPLALASDLIQNGSMEIGDGAGAIDEQIAENWTEVGVNIERSAQYNVVPAGAGHALKAFGDGDNTSVAALQVIANVSPGQSVSASAKLFSPANDKLRGSGQAGIVLQFLNQFDGNISSSETYVLDVNSPSDTWIPASIGPITAPANTAKVRITCRLKWNLGDVLGAGYWDDVQVLVNGVNKVVNGDFEIAGPSPGQSPYGIEHWLGFNDQEKSDDVALDGSFSLKLGTNYGYSGLYQDFGALVEGDEITLTAYYYNPSADPLQGNSRAGIKLEFDSAISAPPEETLSFTESATPDTWTLVTHSTTVPDGITIARVMMVYYADGTTSGSVHFDSAYAERGGDPGTNQLSNDSFEFGPGGFNGLTDWTELNSDGVSQLQASCFEVTAHDGDCTARGFGNAPAFIYQEIPVIPGESLDISAYLMTPSFEPLSGATAKCGVKVEWYAGGVPDDIDIGTPGDGHTIGASAPTDTWIPLTIHYVMPPGSGANLRFTNIIEKGNALSGTVYVDLCSAVTACSPCDANCDGSVNGFDVDPFVGLLTGSGTPCASCSGDVNGDGSVNGFDVDGFVAALTGGGC